MIVLDTNVISEISNPNGNERVYTWFGYLSKRKTAVTAVTVGEAWEGIVRLDEGARRKRLTDDFEGMLQEFFSGRVLPYDHAAAQHYAIISVKRSAAGLPIDKPDAQIAAICAARGFTLATRNIKDFIGTGIELINPWE
ncbi:type II toxin-antitoxin system VapC family toxin [Glycomyces algeriensis]|jgi:toxin FitB|uniref:Ribonuclease VapC n=1 Tax=Glycomyces algeriensis TaxID=256037 RepID=A0A9W6G8A7_9ACTN|nr:type II toxin-antitoxin system VapC family toxin [Glycomyces algeriensis]MDA1367975.1 type II toxin-antitoxin system VapC family toxin [Glycomyces algeriensis]MDR7349514.1 putative nucleic acid-binding protein [Glycomyces algeriensis]GLI42220.1 ribonuclease VapC [Glycomyces algeriensis]